MCESMINNCNLNLGAITLRVTSMAKGHLPGYLASKKKKIIEHKREEEGPSWKQELMKNNNKLAAHLNKNN